MDARTITSGLSVSPQITADDLQAVADQGFRAIICNRPDGEGMDQPNFEEIETAAQALGLQTAYLPITAGKVTVTRMQRRSAAF
jgi:sulfide:quinone oxidoreductase